MKFFALVAIALAAGGQQYTPESEMVYPADYREWVFLSSGSGMTYGPAAGTAHQGAPLFDNVFVNPSSYRDFLKTGRWPNGTQFVLEVRNSESHGSINRDGHYQAGLAAFETEVKDARGEWKFYGFPLQNGKPAKSGRLMQGDASCYSCHAKNTAVENTFVQFYPVLMEVAQRMGTVKKEYVP